MTTFPELNDPPHSRLIKLDEDWMKSKEGKERWRNFIESYKDKVKDYNFGSLIRTNAEDEYGEMNTIFGLYSPALEMNYGAYYCCLFVQ